MGSGFGNHRVYSEGTDMKLSQGTLPRRQCVSSLCEVSRYGFDGFASGFDETMRQQWGWAAAFGRTPSILGQ